MSAQDKMRSDFKNFLWYIWKHLGLPAPTPTQYEFADFLQGRLCTNKRRMIQAWRGQGKSWITAAFVLWMLWKDPNLKFLVVSASKQRADEFSTFVKKLIAEVPLLKHLKPRPEEGQRDSMWAFDVGPCSPAHAPSVKSVGVFGQITGSRADIIIADDVENISNSATVALRDKLCHVCDVEFNSVMQEKIMMVNGEAKKISEGTIIYLGTPQSEESIYNKLPEKGYTVWIWPVRLPTFEKVERYKGTVAQSVIDRLQRGEKPGTPTDPVRFNEHRLIEMEASMGHSGFALQMMLDTSRSDAEKYPLKLSDMIVTNVTWERIPIALSYGSSPDLEVKTLPSHTGFTGDKFYRPMYVDNAWVAPSGVVMSIDPSGRGGDETAFAVVAMLHGRLFVLDYGGFRGGYSDEVLMGLGKIAKRHGVNKVLVESNFGDGMFTKILSPVLNKIYPVTIEEVRHSQQKEKRIIDTLEPILNQHRLVFDHDCIRRDLSEVNAEEASERAKYYTLIYQLTHVTKERGCLPQDDRLDALAIAVAHWVEQMSVDESCALNDYKDQLLMFEINKFLEQADARLKVTCNWNNSILGRGRE